jgi:hypothetical protein
MKPPSNPISTSGPSRIKQFVEFLEHPDVQASAKKLFTMIKTMRAEAQQVQVQKAEVVTYNEVVEYFVKNRPDNERVVKGALLIQEDPIGKKLTFVFLDASNEPVLRDGKSPYGKTVITQAIDEALLDFSEGRSLIIFE